jgi:hypothetical protein
LWLVSSSQESPPRGPPWAWISLVGCSGCPFGALYPKSFLACWWYRQVSSTSRKDCPVCLWLELTLPGSAGWSGFYHMLRSTGSPCCGFPGLLPPLRFAPPGTMQSLVFLSLGPVTCVKGLVHV